MTINWSHPLVQSVVRFFGIALIVMLAMWMYFHYRVPNTNEAIFKKAATAAHDTTQAAQAQRTRIVPLLTSARSAYTAQRSAVINSGNATPRENTTIRKSDAVLAMSDSLVKADSAVILAQQHELQVWKNKPGEPRVRAYGEALYDLLHQQPVVRAGMTARVVGPISLSAAGEYDLPTVTAKQELRGLVGVRITF